MSKKGMYLIKMNRLQDQPYFANSCVFDCKVNRRPYWKMWDILFVNLKHGGHFMSPYSVY